MLQTTQPSLIPSTEAIQQQLKTFKRDQGPRKVVVTAFLAIAGLVVTAGLLTTVQLSQTNQDVRSLAATDRTEAVLEPTPEPTPVVLVGQDSDQTKLTTSFYLQGLSKAAITINDVEVSLKYKDRDNDAVVTTYNVPFTSGADGLLSTTIAINDKISLQGGQSLPDVEIYVKTPTSLRGKLGTLTVIGGKDNSITNEGDLIVGDFVRNGTEANNIKLTDISKAMAEFTDLENPITDSNREFDVDYNGIFNLQDIAIVLQNYNDLEYLGEQL